MMCPSHSFSSLSDFVRVVSCERFYLISLYSDPVEELKCQHSAMNCVIWHVRWV